MMNLILTAVIVTLLTWSTCDLYDFAIYFSRLRDLAKRWSDSPFPVRSWIGKGLTCRYCLSHWVAAGWLTLLFLLPTRFAADLTMIEAVLLVLMAARIAVLIGDNILPPISEIQGNKSEELQVTEGYVAYVEEPDDGGTWTRNVESPVTHSPQEAIEWATGYLMNRVFEGTGTTAEPEFSQTVCARMKKDYTKGTRTIEPGKYPEFEEDGLYLQIVIDTVPLSEELIRHIRNDVSWKQNDNTEL